MKKVRGGFIFNTEDSTLLVTNTLKCGVSKIYKTKNGRFLTTFEPNEGETTFVDEELEFIPEGMDGVDEIIKEWEAEGDDEIVFNLDEFKEG